MWKSFDFGPTTKQDIKENSKPKLRKEISKHSVPTNKRPIATRKRSLNFYEKLTPKTVSDLAVHPKKLEEIEEWLKYNVIVSDKKKVSYLLISGPSGCGKTIAVNVICKSMGISISEWINPVDQDYEIKGKNQINQFLEFLVECKWNSLFESENKKIILVEDFPNAVIHRPEQFFQILEECCYRNTNPIVFICTENNSSKLNLTRTLFPDEILKKYNINHTSFNASAPTLMKKALKRMQVIVKENPDLFEQPSHSIIEAIITSSVGDIRNAVNQFYIASLIGSTEIPTISEDVENPNKRRRTNKDVKLKMMLKDESLGLFHGLGRVLCPKRKQVGNSWRLCHDVEKLVDEFSTQPNSFTAFLFENYLKYFGDLTDVCKAADILSTSIVLLEKWSNSNEVLIVALWVSVLGLMIFNEHKISKWTQIRAPTKALKCARSTEAYEVNPTDYFYYNLINGTDKFHKFVTDI